MKKILVIFLGFALSSSCFGKESVRRPSSADYETVCGGRESFTAAAGLIKANVEEKASDFKNESIKSVSAKYDKKAEVGLEVWDQNLSYSLDGQRLTYATVRTKVTAAFGPAPNYSVGCTVTDVSLINAN